MKFNPVIAGFLFALLIPNLQQATGVIEVKVIDSQGNPISEASVYARSQTDFRRRVGGDTDKEGRFVIKNLPEGEYFVDAYKESERYPIHFSRIYETDRRVWQIVKALPGKPTQVSLQLGPKCATLQLTIEDPAGRPTGASVKFIRLDNARLGSMTVGHDLSGYKEYLIPPDAPLRIEVGISADTKEQWATWRSEPLKVQSGDVLKLKVRFGKTRSTVVQDVKLEPIRPPKVDGERPKPKVRKTNGALVAHISMMPKGEGISPCDSITDL